jgi:hypothetical protein
MTVRDINEKYLPGFCAKHARSWHDDVWPAMVNGIQAACHREGPMLWWDSDVREALPRAPESKYGPIELIERAAEFDCLPRATQQIMNEIGWTPPPEPPETPEQKALRAELRERARAIAQNMSRRKKPR